jgi:transposase
MTRFDFTQADRQAFHDLRFQHPHPFVQRKMETLWLKSRGLPHHMIADLAGVTENTVRAYLYEFMEGGIEALKRIPFHRPTSELAEHQSTIEDYFREHPPADIKTAAAKVEELTGIRRSPTQVRTFLLNIGMRCRKVAAIPAKADPQAQEEFKNNELLPRLEEAEQGKRTVFFVDAAHFVFSAFLGWLWSFARVFVRAPSGRQRFNVLGALNAITHELLTVTNTGYINAQSVCMLLEQIAALSLATPITLVMDNARYQRCALVQGLAKQLGIEILFLPSYSPNLNLIERLWKFVKKKCLYSTYYENFTAFHTAIASCLDHPHQQFKDELDSLLTLNFQSFDIDACASTTHPSITRLDKPRLRRTPPPVSRDRSRSETRTARTLHGCK